MLHFYLFFPWSQDPACQLIPISLFSTSYLSDGSVYQWEAIPLRERVLFVSAFLSLQKLLIHTNQQEYYHCHPPGECVVWIWDKLKLDISISLYKRVPAILSIIPYVKVSQLWCGHHVVILMINTFRSSDRIHTQISMISHWVIYLVY